MKTRLIGPVFYVTVQYQCSSRKDNRRFFEIGFLSKTLCVGGKNIVTDERERNKDAAEKNMQVHKIRPKQKTMTWAKDFGNNVAGNEGTGCGVNSSSLSERAV